MEVTYKVRKRFAQEYITNYRSAEMTMAACEQCPNFGRTWSCPPFQFDFGEMLKEYKEVILIAMTVKSEPTEVNMSTDILDNLSAPYRRALSRRLLGWEERYGGRSFSTIGRCEYCAQQPCARLSGEPCRHPELIRPSLEAAGFDLVRTSSEILDIPLFWAGKERGNIVQLTYIYGFFR